jgi:hypothetical protein
MVTTAEDLPIAKTSFFAWCDKMLAFLKQLIIDQFDAP